MTPWRMCTTRDDGGDHGHHLRPHHEPDPEHDRPGTLQPGGAAGGTRAAGFPDVAAGAWYADAVNWAAARGIVKGYDTGAFGPEDSVTREQLAAILYRYAQAKGYDTTQGGMAVREFSDSASISDWAQTAMSWAVNAQVLSGKGNGVLDPQGTATPRRGGPDADELRRARGLNTAGQKAKSPRNPIGIPGGFYCFAYSASSSDSEGASLVTVAHSTRRSVSSSTRMCRPYSSTSG